MVRSCSVNQLMRAPPHQSQPTFTKPKGAPASMSSSCFQSVAFSP